MKTIQTIINERRSISESFIAYHGSGNVFDKISIGDKFTVNNKTVINGESLYRSLGNPMAASELLSNSGIAGMIYYDGGKNYVIFDPTTIKIKKKTNF